MPLLKTIRFFFDKKNRKILRIWMTSLIYFLFNPFLINMGQTTQSKFFNTINKKQKSQNADLPIILI